MAAAGGDLDPAPPEQVIGEDGGLQRRQARNRKVPPQFAKQEVAWDRVSGLQFTSEAPIPAVGDAEFAAEPLLAVVGSLWVALGLAEEEFGLVGKVSAVHLRS